MAQHSLTPEQKLFKCRTNLYLERNKVKLLKARLDEQEEADKETRDFINRLVMENSRLQTQLIEMEYKIKGDTKDV